MSRFNGYKKANGDRRDTINLFYISHSYNDSVQNCKQVDFIVLIKIKVYYLTY